MPTKQEILRVLKEQRGATRLTVALRPSSRDRMLQIQAMVARYYGVRAPELRGNNRSPSIVFPRDVAMWLCLKHCPHTTITAVAKSFLRGHGVGVSQAIARIDSRKTIDPTLNTVLACFADVIARGQ